MPKYIGVGGVAREVTTQYIGVGGVARKITDGYIGVDGVARRYFGKIDISEYGGKLFNVTGIMKSNNNTIVTHPDFTNGKTLTFDGVGESKVDNNVLFNTSIGKAYFDLIFDNIIVKANDRISLEVEWDFNKDPVTDSGWDEQNNSTDYSVDFEAVIGYFRDQYNSLTPGTDINIQHSQSKTMNNYSGNRIAITIDPVSSALNIVGNYLAIEISASKNIGTPYPNLSYLALYYNGKQILDWC